MTAALLTVDEVSARLAVSPRTVRQLVATRRLAAVRVGRLVRVRPEALAAYIASNETQVEPGDQPAPLAVVRPLVVGPDVRALEDSARRRRL